MRKSLLSVLASLLFFGVVATSQGAPIDSESIITNPASTANLWEYSSFADPSLSSSSYYTSSSQYSSAVFEGYLTGNGVRPNVDHFEDYSNLSRTSRVFRTYIMSAVDQTVRFGIGGDDGHSIFIDDNFLAGGGYAVNVSSVFDMVANQSYELTEIGNNAGGHFELLSALSGGYNETTGEYSWSGPVSNAQNISMDAAGTFSPVPIPGAIWLFGSALIGLAGVTRRNK